MCGIVGYVGNMACSQILFDGLRRLEYRGYDSAGLAIHEAGKIDTLRAVGKLVNLARAMSERGSFTGTVGIGHTRWATHGRPSEANAHPHVAAGVAVVHNGIIENHVELKKRLIAEGVEFRSDTDTEIVAHLLSRAAKANPGLPLVQQLRIAIRDVRGAYALAVLSELAPDEIVLAKYASPLVVGLGEDEVVCGSDIPAILSRSRDVVFLEDGEFALMRKDGLSIWNSEGEPVERKAKRINWSPVEAEKGGYKHFMLKEIFEQPRAIEDTLRGRFSLETGDMIASEFGIDPERLSRIRRVCFIACGTSYHASSVGRYWMEALARIPSTAEHASEVRYRNPIFNEYDLVVAVSQSGETLDTMAALSEAKAAGATIVSIVNVIDSAIARASHGVIYTHAGPEIGVASTKCYTAQLAAIYLLTLFLGQSQNSISQEERKKKLAELVKVPEQMRAALEQSADVYAVARRYSKVEHMLFLGRGYSYPTAMEGALKLKEISYCHAEAYAAGEMKHGPIALIDENMPTVVILPSDSHYEKTLSGLQEVKARDGEVIAIVDKGDDQASSLADAMIEIPVVVEEMVPLVAIVPLQLLAYHIADIRGTDVDQPRNLAKTVTVE